MPVIVDSEKGLDVLDELAELAVKRAENNAEDPLLLIYIEECDMAMLDQQRFDTALITINTHAIEANIKLLFSTSRPSPDVISKKLLESFDLILAGELASEADATYLGVPQIPSERFGFSIRSNK